MTRARDIANLGTQAGSGLDASDITTGVLPVGVTGGSGLNALTFPTSMILQTSVLTPYSLSSNVTTTSGSPVQCIDGNGELSMVTRGTNSKFIIHYSGNYQHQAPTGNRGVVSYIHFCNGAWSSVGANVTASTAQGSGSYFHDGSDWQDVVGSITCVHTPSYTKGDTLRWREHFNTHSTTTTGYWHHTGGLQADTNTTTAYYQGWAMEISQ